MESFVTADLTFKFVSVYAAYGFDRVTCPPLRSTRLRRMIAKRGVARRISYGFTLFNLKFRFRVQ